MTEEETQRIKREKEKTTDFSTVSKTVIVILILIVVLLLAIPHILQEQVTGTLTPCLSNMKNIGTALEMYATDNLGHYPSSLSMLTPRYLKVIPTCFNAKKDTYSGSYTQNLKPDAYTFFCSGSYHKDTGTPPNYPQYNSTDGLTARL